MTPQEPGPDIPAYLGESPGEAGLSLLTVGVRTQVMEAPGNICQHKLTEVAILALRPGCIQQPAFFSAGIPQVKQQTAWAHSPTHQQTGCLKSS